MKTKTIFSFIILLGMSFTYSALGQNGDFSGKWKLNRVKTPLEDNRLILASISVTLKNDSLLTTRVYENGNGDEYPFEEKLSLDGKDSKIVIYDMPRVARASWSKSDGTLLIETTTTFNGNNGEENLTTKEIWEIDGESKLLTINFTSKFSGGESSGTVYFDRVK